MGETRLRRWEPPSWYFVHRHLECQVGGAADNGQGFCENKVCVNGGRFREHIGDVSEHRTGQDVASAEAPSLSGPSGGGFCRGTGRFRDSASSCVTECWTCLLLKPLVLIVVLVSHFLSPRGEASLGPGDCFT